MVKINIKKYIIALSAFICALVVIIFVLKPNKSDLRDKIVLYCEKNDTIQMQNITDFDWDMAYVDRQKYGVGEVLLQRGIQGDFKELDSDFMYRVAFCKNNILVYELILNESFIVVDNSILDFTPQTIFHIQKRTRGDGSLVLTLKTGDGSLS